MTVKIIPQTVINAKRFFQETILSNKNILSGNKFLYKKEDIEWMTNIWIKNYDKIKENPTSYYMILTLLNRNTRSGRFALIYNDLVYGAVEKRKDKDFAKLLLNPEFPEIYDNKLLTSEEKEHLKTILKYEMTAINLLIKRQESSKKIELIPSALYNECFLQVSIMYQTEEDPELLKYSSFESPNYITIAEYNDNTDTHHMYSFDLLDLIVLVVFKENNVYTGKPFSEANIENVTSRYNIEIKMIKRAYGK
jgi:hypothetical protein